ncbi:MAG: hypothetical protein WBG90_22210, partial [Saonia sp.]
MKQITVFYLLALFGIVSVPGQNVDAQKDAIILKNSTIQLVQSLKGGAIIALKFKDNPVNPFDWSLPIDNQPAINKNGFAFRGHFISLGTWGMPTKGEQDAGIRLYGEPTAQIWTKDGYYKDSLGNIICSTSFQSKIEGLSLNRKIKLYHNESLVQVKESVT